MSQSTLIIVGGFYNIALVAFHLLFWRLFRWREQLAHLNRLNRAVMQVLNISLTLVFCIFAYLSLFHAESLLTSEMGRDLLRLMSAFWFLRAVQQVIFFQLDDWVSVGFLLFFLAGSTIYLVPALG